MILKSDELQTLTTNERLTYAAMNPADDVLLSLHTTQDGMSSMTSKPSFRKMNLKKLKNQIFLLSF